MREWFRPDCQVSSLWCNTNFQKWKSWVTCIKMGLSKTFNLDVLAKNSLIQKNIGVDFTLTYKLWNLLTNDLFKTVTNTEMEDYTVKLAM